MHYFFLIIAFLSIYMFIYDILHPYNLVRPNTPGLTFPALWCKVRTLSQVRHPELIALYESAPNHVLGQ